MAGQGDVPDAAGIEAIARAAMARMPAAFRAHLGDVVLRVEEDAEPAVLAHFGLDDPRRLSGLYRGRPVGEKSSMESGAMPDEIFLYRRALVAEWRATGVDFTTLVEHVLVHEVGHHFGLSDADMHRLEAE